ncbi:MAG: hypothetical protein HZC54_09960 [Verrucomicrobia bacterium]|nr:hypothetical protein [Verrucomicrobiota bacterium]
MKLPYYIAVVVAVALIAGCGDKEGKVQQPAKGPAATGSGTNAAVKTTVAPAPPPPVTATKPATTLFPSGGAPAAAPAKTTQPSADAKPAVTSAKPATETKAMSAQVSAKVVMVNKEMKFVVLEFSNSAVPTAGSQLSLYRGKERVATVKATEPMKPPLVTADILDGDARKGDEVR